MTAHRSVIHIKSYFFRDINLDLWNRKTRYRNQLRIWFCNFYFCCLFNVVIILTSHKERRKENLQIKEAEIKFFSVEVMS